MPVNKVEGKRTHNSIVFVHDVIHTICLCVLTWSQLHKQDSVKRPIAHTTRQLETAGNFEVSVTYGSFVFPVPTLLFPLKSNLGDLAASAKSPKLLLGAAKSPTLLYPSYFEDIHQYPALLSYCKASKLPSRPIYTPSDAFSSSRSLRKAAANCHNEQTFFVCFRGNWPKFIIEDASPALSILPWHRRRCHNNILLGGGWALEEVLRPA